MTYKSFQEYIQNFNRYDARLALTIRSFVKIERLMYNALQTQVYQTAHYLQDLGLKPGERVMVIGANSPQWMEVLLGAQLVGVTVVPVDMQSSLETVQRYVEQTSPRVIFKDAYLLPGLERHNTCLVLGDLDKELVDRPEEPPEHMLTGNEVALIVFTSGTTADPKGVALTQRNILANVAGVQRALTIDPDWRVLSVLPLSHMYELTGSLSVLSGGASIFYMPRVTPLAVARSLREYRITTILAVPQLLVQFLDRIRETAASQGKAASFSFAQRLTSHAPFFVRRFIFRSVHKNLGGKLDMVVTGGAPIPPIVATAWERMGVKTVQGYGLTETSPILTVNSPNERRIDSQGQALYNVQLRIHGPDHELQAKGPSVFKEYWHNEAATKAAFTSDGWFKTGDIGRLADGWLQIRGRTKFTITLASGLKVSPEDIEVVAETNAALGAICVVSEKHPEGESVLAVVLSKFSDAALDQAIAQVNEQLESFQRIAAWVRWPEEDFPRTRLLKVDRRRVQEWANARLVGMETVPGLPAKSMETDQLLHVLQLSLNRPPTRIHDTDKLVDLGLDSLGRLTLVAFIEEQLGVSVAESTITQHTTVEGLRKLVAEGASVKQPEAQLTWTFNPVMRLLGDTARETLVRGLLRIWVRQHTEGSERLKDLPKGALFIFNHVDDFDAPVIYKALPRQVRKHLAIAAADDVLKRHKVLAFIARFGFAGFNFARVEPIMPSLEYVGTLVDHGWHIALAPEGKLSANGKLHPFKSGIGLLAVELGVPVVPVKTIGLYGTVPLHSKWPKKHSRVTVRIGEPVRFSHDVSYEDATAQLHASIDRL